MKKHSRLFWILIALAALLSGCVGSINDLLIAPKLPGENELLKEELDKIRGSGAVSAVPETGERQSVKIIDLDADGVEEAIAFFRTAGGGYSMYVFRWEESKYVLVGVEEGSGFSLRSVLLPVCGKDGRRALAVAWSLDETGTRFGMSVYGYDGQALHHMLDTQYSYIHMEDVDGDSVEELIFITNDPETERGSVNIYMVQDHRYFMYQTVPLCIEAVSVKNIKLGLIAAPTKGLFIDSMTEGQNYVTDVINISDRRAVNETMDPASGEGAITLRTVSVYCRDIDGDGIIEVPARSEMASAESGDLMRNLLDWHRFAEGKIVKTIGSTLHSTSDEWFIRWPENWDESVKVRRTNSIHMTRTEFYLSVDEEGIGILSDRPLLYVMIFTGDNRSEYLKQYASAIVLRKTSSKIYCFSLPGDTVAGYSLTEEAAAQILTVDAY